MLKEWFVQVLRGFQKIDYRMPGADRTQISCGGAYYNPKPEIVVSIFFSIIPI